jgi:hypothetical protein
MSEFPVVTIAGKEYAVPPLVTKQLRIVIPAIMRLGPLASDASKLTTLLYDDMIQILFWGAIWPNDKKATTDVLLDAHIPFLEMQKAMKVIRDQTGLFMDAPKEGAPSGEASP